jgi:DNA-binding SARP family transcriptional activator
MAEDKTEQVRESLKNWIELDDQERQIRSQIKTLKEQKSRISSNILTFMKDNEVDNFALEGNGVGTLSRTVRTSRPPLRRNLIRTQILMHLADEPQRAAEILRSIEGIPEGAEDMSVGGTQRELLVRRLPREKKTVVI